MRKTALSIILILLSINFTYGQTRLLRYPHSSDSQITFVHAGDVFIVPVEGGVARRITSSAGEEMFPRFSPDGKLIAFSAEYDGNREVYSMSSLGGTPKRLTYSVDIGSMPERMGPDKIVLQWSPDGKKIYYRSRHEIWNAWLGKIYSVSLSGGEPDLVPLPRAGFCSFSPDMSKIAYNRIFREYRTWKRYRGGQADDIWIYDFTTKELENISNNLAQDIIPLWYKTKIYYLSDRDHTMNLFCYDLKTKQSQKITDFSKFDIKFPSLGSKYITFENGGFIFTLDPETDKYQKVNIEVREDFPETRSSIVSVSESVRSMDISPSGKRALFSARGDIFTVPQKNGMVRNLTKSSGVHDRSAVWSPDGKWIAFISDKSGEDEIYTCRPDGSELSQITNDAESYRFNLSWSPDSKKILCSDKSMRLYFIDIKSKKTTVITKSKTWELRDYAWSGDSKWIAFTDAADNYNSVIYLYSLFDNKLHIVTDKFFNSRQPVFSKSGKYLFFVSDRVFRHREGLFERSYAYNRDSKLYGLILIDTLDSPFKFLSDDVDWTGVDEKKKSKKKKKNKKKKSDKVKESRIDLDNIAGRIFEIPVDKGRFNNLTSVGDEKLYYNRDGLHYYDFEEREEVKVSGKFRSRISPDEKQILIRKGKDFFIEKLTKKVKPEKGKLDLSGMKVFLDRKAEWRQIFEESWRQMKYFFYAPNLHEVEWDSIKANYLELLPYVQHRCDLTYIIGEMIGELNTGHAYAGGGDKPKVEKIAIGHLGCEFEYDHEKQAYKISRIFEGRNWENLTRSPLTEPGVDINEGDYLVSIDGQQLSESFTPSMALVNKSEKFVNLEILYPNKKGSKKSFDVKTIKNESGLRYFNWVESNRRYVDSVTDGKVGYVHIPNMMRKGLNEFVKYYYPQLTKKGLIIDDRFNGGGNVSPMIIERLRRNITMAGYARNQQIVQTFPNSVFLGPMVCLLNELSASDGDMFPYEFKRSNLGKLIGKRSWGGVIGIRGSLPLLDGGYLYKPEFSHFGLEGDWILEGVGMKPDIEVDNHPAELLEGKDAQLDRAIKEILEDIKNYKGPTLPKLPKFPNKK